ncbi:MAG TPA: glycosyltransferase [Gammaproteobacteria bacterium]|nr:glycosyltransferase [Gammaproteobacteria bacterium]
MPCYNAGPYLREAVDCVLNQTYPQVELVVVDDGSTDGSRQVLADYGDQITFIEQNNQGPYPARNNGLSRATGEYVAFLDADDYWTADCLEKLHAALIRAQADLVYCGWQNVGEHATNSEPYVPPAYEEDDVVVAFLRSCPWPIHAALIRRTVLDAIDGFSTRRFSSMDYDLWLRIYGHTRNIVRLPEVLAFYRWHGSTQISATKWKQVLDAVQVRRDFVAKFGGLTAHIPAQRLRDLVEGQLLKEAYRAYWKRDLANARPLFRHALRRGAWQVKDLKYILPALLSAPLFARLVAQADKAAGEQGA